MAWRSWGLDEVDKWLAKHGLVQVAPKFREEEIDGSALEGLCEADVAELLPKMGPRGKFRVALKQLKNRSVEVQNAELSDGTAAQNLNLRVQNVPAQIPNLGMQNASAQISSRDVQNVSRLSERTGSIKEKQSTTLQMSKGAQLTIDQLLQPRQSTSFFDDRYAELKKIGFKVFSDSFIENEMPMKQKWYRFWNEEALKLFIF